MTTFEIIGLLLIFSGLFIAYHMYVAPTMDDNGRVTKQGKKLSDLWRKQK